jgi:uncharacterized membrane protein
VVIQLLLAGAHAAQAQAVTCGQAGPYADAQIAYLQQIVGGTSEGAAASRAAFHLQPASPSAVRLATDDSLCTVAANALRRTMNATELPLARTWVIQVGPTRYWVYDPRFKSVIDIIHAVFDESWANLSLVTG